MGDDLPGVRDWTMGDYSQRLGLLIEHQIMSTDTALRLISPSVAPASAVLSPFDAFDEATLLAAAKEFTNRFPAAVFKRAPEDILQGMRKGTDPLHMLDDHLPDYRSAGTGTTLRLLSIEDFEVSLRYADSVRWAPRLPGSVAERWLMRCLNIKGHTLVSGTVKILTDERPQSRTLLDNITWVVYAKCRIIPLGQTYGLPGTLTVPFPKAKEVSLRVREERSDMQQSEGNDAP